jgi:hypothetical protein
MLTPPARLWCGKVLLPTAAIFILRILRSPAVQFAPVEEAPEFQKVVYSEC